MALIAANDFLIAPPQGRILFSFVDWPPRKEVAPSGATAPKASTEAEPRKLEGPPKKTEVGPSNSATVTSKSQRDEPRTPSVMIPDHPLPAPKAQMGPFPGPPTVEQITQNWTSVPKGFFRAARQVSLTRDVELVVKIPNGRITMKLQRGASLPIFGYEGGLLIVAPTPDSPLRAELAADFTDFKEVFAKAYAEVNARRVEATAREQQAVSSAANNLERTENETDTIGPPPARVDDGSYPILVSSMKNGDVTEIKPGNVKQWAEPVRSGLQGNDYLIVKVKFDTVTQFGKYETEAQAHVLKGKVTGWFYSGSGEQVP